MSETAELDRAELKPDAIEDHEYNPGMCKLTITIERDKVDKLMAFMRGDTWEKAQAIRSQELEVCAKSLEWCANKALRHDYSGAVTLGQFISSLYNGNRVKTDISRLFGLDAEHFEHLMNALRLCWATHREPHTFFKSRNQEWTYGNDIFEDIIKKFGFEKKRRARS